MPGVIASYRLNGDAGRVHPARDEPDQRPRARWFVRHGDELVDTMAAPFGPDVVGLLKTDVTYGVMGDHGGHNRLIQNIPMIFAGPGVGRKDSEPRAATRRRDAHGPRADGDPVRHVRPRRKGGAAPEAVEPQAASSARRASATRLAASPSVGHSAVPPPRSVTARCTGLRIGQSRCHPLGGVALGGPVTLLGIVPSAAGREHDRRLIVFAGGVPVERAAQRVKHGLPRDLAQQRT